MVRNFLSGLLIVFLMFSYINRGLFIDMTEVNFTYSKYAIQTKGEINSALELILKLTGFGENDIDEDGDSPENYTTINLSQLLVCHEFAQILKLNNSYLQNIKKSFYVFSDLIYSQPVYGQIDHPPES